MLKRCLFLVACLFLGFVELKSSSFLPNVIPQFPYEKGSTWKEPFFFIQLADCQFGLLTNNSNWGTEKSLLEQAVVHINRLKPKFVILCGDMVHAPPNGTIHEKEMADYKSVVSKIDPSIPLICVCGNHDVWNRPEAKVLYKYEHDFGTPHYASFWVDGVQCLMLNSSLIYDPSRLQTLYQQQYNWFEEQLQITVNGRAPSHRLVFLHHPWYVKSPSDPDGYGVIPKERRMQFLEMLANADVTACFFGHLHSNVYSNYKGVQMIISAATAVPSVSGLRVVKVYQDHIQHTYYKMSSVPQKVTL